MNYILIKGSTYTADVKLGLLESMASNSTIESRLKDAGFDNVQVIGTGRARRAMAVWRGETGEYPVPSQVSNIIRVLADPTVP